MQETIIGRLEEKRLMQQYVESETAEFIALYGRRRVGKTFLVRQFFGNKFSFEVTGIIDGKMTEQLAAFNNALQIYGYHGSAVKNWIDAFFALRKTLEPKIQKGGKCILFIDELPCLDTPRSGFVRALGHFWNSWAAWQPTLKLIICGSATSWMVRNIIDNHGGLHDRVTHEMALKPFTLAETEHYFLANNFQWSRLGVLHAYMAVGGIPYYLSLFNPTESPAQGIDRLFFFENAELSREYNRLFASLFRNPTPYMSVIKLLAEKPSGMTREEMAKELKIDNNGYFGDIIMDLVYCDFLRGFHVREKKLKSSSAIYKLVDFYTIFYHTFCGKTAEPGYWLRVQGTPKVNTWHGLAYERVAMAHIAQIKIALGISGVVTESYASIIREPEAKYQIDLIIERADKMINLCEVKYSESEYVLNQEEYLKITRRLEAFKRYTNTRFGLVPTLITTFGLARGMYADSIHATVSLDNLFS